MSRSSPRLWTALKPLIFGLDPELAHGLSLHLLRLAAAVPGGSMVLRRVFAPVSPQPVTAFGLNFSHPVGLAAGYDKDGIAWRGLACLGFSHVEIGTVTPQPQGGNPKPRVFRLVDDRGVINRLGFPSRGMEFVAAQLGGPRPDGVVLGVNIGKNKDTALVDAAGDYLAVMTRLYDVADYIAVNVSSPNTPGLRDLQGGDYLGALLTTLVARRDELAARSGTRKPLLVKIAPDLDDDALRTSAGAIVDAAVDGVIATNTTVARAGLTSSHRAEKGGLSGAPLTDRSTERLATLCRFLGPEVDVVGVGGVMAARDAAAKIAAGAKLVQVYSGMVYAGPGLASAIASQLPRLDALGLPVAKPPVRVRNAAHEA